MAQLYDRMMVYHPYHGGENPHRDFDSQTLLYLKRGTVYNPVREQQFLSRIKEFLKGHVAILAQQRAAARQRQVPIVLALAPGHTEGFQSGFLLQVVQDLVRDNPSHVQLIDGSKQLVRTITVDKSTNTPGPRDLGKHRHSIEVYVPPYVDEDSNPAYVRNLNKGKIVFVIDDVWTSGATLTVCAEKIHMTGASDVKLIAIGKTASYDWVYE